MQPHTCTDAGSPRQNIASPDKILPVKIRSTNPIACVINWTIFSNEIDLRLETLFGEINQHTTIVLKNKKNVLLEKSIRECLERLF